MLCGMAKVVITKDETGTYVSDYNIEPLVNVIQAGGTRMAWAIASMSTIWRDYTEELQNSHIRESSSKTALEGVWNEIFADASTGMDDPKHPLTAGTPIQKETDAATSLSPSPSAEVTPMVSPDAVSPSPTANAA